MTYYAHFRWPTSGLESFVGPTPTPEAADAINSTWEADNLLQAGTEYLGAVSEKRAKALRVLGLHDMDTPEELTPMLKAMRDGDMGYAGF
jgi:hypothetical protein